MEDTMATVNPYASEYFDTLPDFGMAQGNLSAHGRKLDAFGRLLNRHGATEEVGLALLHRHFDLSPEEILVETVSVFGAESIGAPQHRKGVGKVIPHLFRAVFDETSGECIWYPLEFCNAESDDGTLAARYAKFAASDHLLNEIAQALWAEDAIDAIGLSLFHGREEIRCDPDEILTESTDYVKRILVMRPRKVPPDGELSTPTLWRFDSQRVCLVCTCIPDSRDGPHPHYETGVTV